ncbi:MAG TPA: hypothetical protein VN455_12965 [Methanotrichaceae archaeon]|nr:hypothetical protein [Methanotrichaceae archaeon]
MNLKLLFALFVAVILVGAVVADAKGRSGGGHSSFGGKSFGASKSTGSGLNGAPAAGQVAPVPASYAKRPKTGSNFMFPMLAGFWMGRSMNNNNQSPNDDGTEQSPGIPAALAIGGILAAWRMTRGRRAA